MQRLPVLRRVVCSLSLLASGLWAASSAELARDLVAKTGFAGGLVVQVGSGDGELLAALSKPENVLATGLEPDATAVQQARKRLHDLGVYGRVSVRQWDAPFLPFVDNLANLVVVTTTDSGVSAEELRRIAAPNGAVCTLVGDSWQIARKPRPEDIDEWTHWLHGPDGNPVAQDDQVQPPRHLQWVGSPRWSRHHDRMASMSALVTAKGRIFYIMDEGSRAIVQLPPKWKLIARDAFNGTILWKRDIPTWHFQLWALKSGPADLTQRLVAIGDRVYVTLGLDAPVTALDAATGETVRTYANTKNTECILVDQGTVYAVTNPTPTKLAPFIPDRSGTWNDTRRLGKERGWDEKPRTILAFDAASGAERWRYVGKIVPMSLSLGPKRAYFHDGDRLLALDRGTGRKLWASEPVSRRRYIARRFGPNLIVYGDALLFSGGDRKMYGVDAPTGKILWTAHHPPSGHSSQEDLMVVNGLVWAANIGSGKGDGIWRGRDPRTGEVKVEFPPDVKTYWFHHRCYRSKATKNFLLPSRTGIEFVDFRKKHWDINHWVRGGCIYGIMPANGMTYTPPHSCACYMETKLFGFNALTGAAQRSPLPAAAKQLPRLVKGPAYDAPAGSAASAADWPTFRHDPVRSGTATTHVGGQLSKAWEVELKGRLTPPVIVGDLACVAATDAHTVYGLDAQSGAVRWQYTAGARVDSPPTLYQGRALFGCADGWVYCLRASDGALCWRFRGAPGDRLLCSYEQLESVWPISGSVLVENGMAYFVAGRSMFLDHGLRLCRIDAKTGELVSETVMNETIDGTNRNLQELVEVLNMPVGLPDVLSSDGKNVYMRSQRLTLDGKIQTPTPQPTEPAKLAAMQEGEDRHLFCPNGFLDGDWLHRTYWIFGRRYSSGCNWYHRAGQFTPAGRILSFDDKGVYGFGRRPEYFEWSVPMEYQVFACDRDPKITGARAGVVKGVISVSKSPSLSPKGTPLSVSAWVLLRSKQGAVLARGGASHGYGILIEKRKPAFALRLANKLAMVTGPDALPLNTWVHLAGVLAPDKTARLYVNGKLVGETQAPSFIAADPNEGMQIGIDAGSPLGEYKKGVLLNASIDEVRIYSRALSDGEVGLLARSAEGPSNGLALRYSFDGGKANDLSGNGNEGTMDCTPTAGRFGAAMSFGETATDRKGKPLLRPKVKFAYRWSQIPPIYGRALVKTADAILVAGPPDVVDEEEAYQRPHDTDIKQKLARQDRAMAGSEGALLLALAAGDGRELGRAKLAAPPVWDGMAVRGNAVFLSTIDGKVSCWRGQ
jgi:outer membrane protein assembly factor BamB